MIFYIKLIVNKRGAPEAPPIHYPINFISKKSKICVKTYQNIQQIQKDIPKEKHQFCLHPFASLQTSSLRMWLG